MDPRRLQEREGGTRGSAAQAREEDAHAGLTAETGRPKSVTGRRGNEWAAASGPRERQGEGGVWAFGPKPEGRVLLFLFSVSLFF